MVLLSLVSGKSAFLRDGYVTAIKNCCAPTAVKRTLFPMRIASLLLGTLFNTIRICYELNVIVRPAFVNTLLPVTRLYHIYSTALVIIILIDNLKYVIIFVYVWFLPWKIPAVSENASRCPSKQNFR